MAKSIIHFYRLEDSDVPEEVVNEMFSQKFVHIHLADGTYLIRIMNYLGKKLDFNRDAKELLYLMDFITKEFDQIDLEKIREFINDDNTKEDSVYDNSKEDSIPHNK